ncbi:MAG: MFS transporter [Bacteroidales bacterium]|nr:MFS transporter [Bacteroidales bacterium]
MSKRNIFRRYNRTFWTANTMELFERWAWYGMFMLMALYLTGSRDEGALGFTQIQKGHMMGPVVALLYLMPLFTGAIADRYGYKKVLITSYAIMASGYVMLAYIQSYTLFYMAFLWLAVGAALFKPIITATVAKTTNSKTSSVGFGIFYMMVNLGAFIGPIVASKMRVFSWQYVFLISAAVIVFNLLLVVFFYREPEKELSSEPLLASVKTIFRNVWTAVKDVKFLLFLIIIIGFWAMYNQLFFTLPVFINQWMDTSMVYDFLHSISPGLANAIGTSEGIVEPEIMTNLDAMYIVLFQILVSTLVMRFRPLTAMTSGIIVASVGLALSFATNNPFFLVLSLLIFAVGEMSSSPKINEYIGKIAPKDKVALYMGASFLPMAGGNLLAGFISGDVYGNLSDKINLLRHDLINRDIYPPEISNDFTQNDLLNMGAEKLQMTQQQLTTYLWDTYQPGKIWIILFVIGIATAIALFLYDYLLIRKGNP